MHLIGFLLGLFSLIQINIIFDIKNDGNIPTALSRFAYKSFYPSCSWMFVPPPQTGRGQRLWPCSLWTQKHGLPLQPSAWWPLWKPLCRAPPGRRSSGGRYLCTRARLQGLQRRRTHIWKRCTTALWCPGSGTVLQLPLGSTGWSVWAWWWGSRQGTGTARLLWPTFSGQLMLKCFRYNLYSTVSIVLLVSRLTASSTATVHWCFVFFCFLMFSVSSCLLSKI